MEKLKQTELAYLAGYFDGEGCVTFSRKWIRVSISSCCPRPIEKLYKLFGGRAADGSYVDRPAARIFSRCTLHGAKAIAFLKLIHPYSLEKEPQIRLALKYMEAGDIEKAEIRAQIKALKKVNYHAKKNTN